MRELLLLPRHGWQRTHNNSIALDNEPRETSTQHHTQFIIVQQGIQQRFLFKEKITRKIVFFSLEKRAVQKASSHFCKYWSRSSMAAREKDIFLLCSWEKISWYLQASRKQQFCCIASARMYSSSLFQPMKIKNIFSAAVASASEAFCRRDFSFI